MAQSSKIRSAMFAGVGAIALTACASVDPTLSSAVTPELPATFVAASDQDALGKPTEDWVAAFGDDALETLIDEAMANNRELLSAVANFDAATANRKIARAGLLPQLNINNDARRSAIVLNPAFAAQAGGGGGGERLRANDLEDLFGVDNDGDGELDGLDTNGDGILEPLPNRRFYINSFQLGAQATWELDFWGRVLDETRAAGREASAAQADLAAAQLSIAGGVAQQWFLLIEARQQRLLAERDVAARERNLGATERRYQSGVASGLDVRLSRSALGTSKAALAQSSRLEREAARRLEVLVGRYPSAEIEGTDALPALPSLDGIGAPAEILTRRPDVIAAEFRMEANGLRARAARKQMLPTLTISSGINTSGPALADVIDPERLAGNIAAGMFQPLFQGGRVRANARRQRALAEASLLSYAQTLLTAFEEAENALAAEAFLSDREKALKTAFEEAAAAEDITERRYNRGAADIFNLLDAQTRRIAAEGAFITSRRERVANRVRLYLAVGGNFEGAGATFDALERLRKDDDQNDVTDDAEVVALSES
ncbi:MAG: TolC family protein [Pseudomonadota bacterium]